MAELEYRPFDYFGTPIDELHYRYSECESYGIKQLDVINYIDSMKQDRDRWEDKASSAEICGIVLQIIITLLIPCPMFIAKICIFNLFDLDNEGMEDSIVIDIIASLISILWVICGWLLWKKNYVVNLVYGWAEIRYKKKTQSNSLIEKFIEDSHWDYYQYMKSLQKHKQ